MQSQIFFFISSLGFIVLAVLIGVAISYGIKAMRSFTKLIDKIEMNVDSIGDTTQDLIDDVRSSAVFRLLTTKARRK
ncbi:MAG: hypothetical protein JWO73_641 [Candidatus Taylorbacteria bacterium]|nr:hypothetical protein [Candidatus Taylorbacteria bacterium]